MPSSWQALYQSQAQSLYALVVLTILFLGVLLVRGFARTAGVEPHAAGFVRIWTVVAGLVTLADPIATGLLGVPMLPFVLAGDYRVLVLLLVVMQPGRARPSALLEAVPWTLAVPGLAYGLYRGLDAVRGGVPETVLWLIYEVAFVGLCVVLATQVVPRRIGRERVHTRRFCWAVLAFVGLYYTLWAVADVAILSGRDWGWALRLVPNQLYYGLLVPFCYALFFAERTAAASTSTHAAR